MTGQFRKARVGQARNIDGTGAFGTPFAAAAVTTVLVLLAFFAQGDAGTWRTLGSFGLRTRQAQNGRLGFGFLFGARRIGLGIFDGRIGFGFERAG